MFYYLYKSFVLGHVFYVFILFYFILYHVSGVDFSSVMVVDQCGFLLTHAKFVPRGQSMNN